MFMCEVIIEFKFLQYCPLRAMYIAQCVTLCSCENENNFPVVRNKK